MYLIQLTNPPILPVGVSELAGHLRIGTGFADDGAEDALLQTYLQSATATIERALSLALATRSYELSVTRWDRDGGINLPVGPVTGITSVTIVDGAVQTALAPARWSLVKGRPARLAPASQAFPALSEGESAKIIFEAGYGTEAADIPADLRQAVALLASDFYEHRSGGFSEAGFPSAVASLINAYRPVRL